MLKLNYLALINAIEKIRVSRKIPQKELINGLIDPSNYSKMKKNQLHINLEDAYELLNRLHANWTDIEDMSLFTSEKERYIHKKYNSLISVEKVNLEDIENFLIEVEQAYDKEKNNGIHRVLLMVKANYSHISNKIPKISEEEIEQIFLRIDKSTIITSIDLKLLGDLTTHFTVEQLKSITPKLIIQDKKESDLRPRIFHTYIPTCQGNIADILIDNQEFETAALLLENLKFISKYNNNFFYYFLAHFLHYRLLYFTASNEEKAIEILDQYEQWLESGKVIFGTTPAFQAYQNSFENLKKTTKRIPKKCYHNQLVKERKIALFLSG